MTLSQLLHLLIFRDGSTSLCGRAWARRDRQGWAAFVRAADLLLGAGHCEASARFHAGRRAGG